MANHQLCLDDITPVSHLQYICPDRKYRSAHLIATASVYVIIMALALLLLLTDKTWLCIAAECLIAITLCINLAIIPRSCRFKGYALREHDISYRSGIIFPKVTTIPFNKIQQVSVRQNPVSKLFNLYAIEIVNGAQAASSLSIPGLTDTTASQIKSLVTDKTNANHD